MKIAIDIDDVIAEFAKGYLEIANAKLNSNFSFEDIFSFKLWESLNITKEQAVAFADEFYDSSSFENIKLVEGAVESIKNLAEKHELFFITSRPLRLKAKTNLFLDTYFPDINFNLIFSSDFFKEQGKTKADICKELGIDFFIEDNKDYAFNCADKGIKVFLFSKPWNKDYQKHENLVKVNNWNEILERLEDEH